MDKKTPLVLMILDGWGFRQEKEHNAIYAANTPQWDSWWDKCPHVLLNAFGQHVGLPDTQMGNSEVGHMHIGAGRVVPQDYTRINQAISTGEFSHNPVFIETCDEVNRHDKTLHILGLLSPGGVHSHEDHLYALLDICMQQHVVNVRLHLFLDGRDTAPQSALNSIETLTTYLIQNPIASIASITGRYYAMDRDTRWDRVQPVYQLLTEPARPPHYMTAHDAIIAFYQQHITDEFIPPTQIGKGAPIQDGDSVIFFNFRADRARQLTQALIANDFIGFHRRTKPVITQFISMTNYAPYLVTRSAYPSLHLKNTLGEALAQHHLSQLRIAETEKYAHVTFFLNGGIETPFPHEDRIIIPSPNVATYDLKPEMSAPELTIALIEAIYSQKYDVIICNYANADMVGHTGNFAAVVCAIECLDKAMSAVWNALNSVGGQLLITADHGNAESMFDETTHQAHTAHTCQPVPLLYVGNKSYHATQLTGSLIDVAPTILALCSVLPPTEMTGQILFTNTTPLSSE